VPESSLWLLVAQGRPEAAHAVNTLILAFAGRPRLTVRGLYTHRPLWKIAELRTSV
jgi:hypothetical protein